jgi:hypothetical protein
VQTGENDTIVVSALRARNGFDTLLRRVEDEHRSLVIENRGGRGGTSSLPGESTR